MKRIGLGVSCVVLWIQGGWAAAAVSVIPAKAKDNTPSKDLPLSSIEAKHRDTLHAIVNKPSFSSRGPAEVFAGKPQQYLWLLDHPHRCVTAWRRLGAKCVAINPKNERQFLWADDAGSEVVWETVFKDASMRIWLAEGKVKPGPLMPTVPMKAVVVLRHHEAKMPDGAMALHHQADLFVHTDSKTAHMLLRMLGPAATRMAEDGLSQLQLFFSGLTWYFDRHPDEVKDLLREEK